jgi:hypothetical protein
LQFIVENKRIKKDITGPIWIKLLLLASEVGNRLFNGAIALELELELELATASPSVEQVPVEE